MTVRRDTIAGGIFLMIAAGVYLISGDLPFGSLASPGPGMLPQLAMSAIAAFAIVVLFQANQSPPIREVGWRDLTHAVRVVAVAAAAIAVYQRAGFLLTISVMLFVLLFVVERRPLARAVAFSVGVSLLAYLLFGFALKSPLPRGVIGF